MTWNVRGAMSSAGSISYLLDKYDVNIACISEHKLKPQCESFLNSINSKYDAYTMCEPVERDRCGKAGVSIMYKKDLSFCVNKLPNNYHRTIGIKLTQEYYSTPIYIFCVYMPSVNYSQDEYEECVDALQSIYDTYSDGVIITCGDLNIDLTINSTGHRQRAIISLLNTNGLSTVGLEDPNYTFRPTKKVLDYVIVHTSQTNLVENDIALDDECCTVSDIYQYSQHVAYLHRHTYSPKVII